MLTPKYPVLIATRSPHTATNHPSVKFDWTDGTTYNNPFEHEQAKDSPITAVYLVGLESDNRSELIISFIHLAVSKGVRRFVLLSSAEIEEGGPLFGQAHGELHKLGDEAKLEWTVLRPHFFMENFIERGYGGYHWQTIMEQGKIYSAAGKGKKPYISARDIAATAYRALVDEKPHNADLYITGPESLTYDDVSFPSTLDLRRCTDSTRLLQYSVKSSQERSNTLASLVMNWPRLWSKSAVCPRTLPQCWAKSMRKLQKAIIGRRQMW